VKNAHLTQRAPLVLGQFQVLHRSAPAALPIRL
jgi:hypothetical protein